MNIKPLPRYDPASIEIETGIGCYDVLSMKQWASGGYINRDELLTSLNQMRANACDPGEKDALNSVIKLLGS